MALAQNEEVDVLAKEGAKLSSVNIDNCMGTEIEGKVLKQNERKNETGVGEKKKKQWELT